METVNAPDALRTRLTTPGAACWWEILTTNPAQATPFYTDLFGWEAVASETPQGPYTLLQQDGLNVVGLYALPEAMQAAHVPPHWLLYLATPDVDAALAVAQAHGGTLVFGPVDVEDMGRMAQLVDPTGAAFCLWEAKNVAGTQAEDQPGTICWSECVSQDAEAAKDFYAAVFGYTIEDPQMGLPYYYLSHGEGEQAGLMQMDAAFGDMPSHWMPYVMVEDIDATVARVPDLGGVVCVPVSSIPIGRFAVLQDPTGATFSVFQPNSPQ